VRVEELLPLASGLVIGLILGLLRPSARVPVGAFLIVAFGVLATVVSGEYLISWSFLLIDIPLVAGSAAASLYVTHRLRWAPRRPG
jgi:xanthosine utilization system XapX-like protein